MILSWNRKRAIWNIIRHHHQANTKSTVCDFKYATFGWISKLFPICSWYKITFTESSSHLSLIGISWRSRPWERFRWCERWTFVQYKSQQNGFFFKKKKTKLQSPNDYRIVGIRSRPWIEALIKSTFYKVNYGLYTPNLQCTSYRVSRFKFVYFVS